MSADTAAVPAVPKKPSVPPATKEDFVPVVQAKIQDVLGIKVAKEKCWDLTKAILGAGYELAAQGKPCSLAGVGKFEVITSGRSGHKIMKFRVSSRIQELLNTGATVFVEPPAAPIIKSDTEKAAPAAPAAPVKTDI